MDPCDQAERWVAVMSSPYRISEPGEYDLPDSVYHGDCCDGPSVSSSGLKKLIGPGPAAFWRECPANPEAVRPAPTKAFDIGRAAHKLILEPEEVHEAVALIPPKILGKNGSASTNDAKAFMEEAREAGKTPVKPEEWAAVTGMRDALSEHPIAQKLLKRGRAEKSIFWRDTTSGLWCKVRPDWLPERDGKYLGDYKTCASLAEFTRAMMKLRYELSAAMYLRGVNSVLGMRPAGFGFIAQEKEAPYRVGTFFLTVGHEVGGKLLKAGELDMRRGLEIAARCFSTGDWPDPWAEPREITPPDYVMGAIDARLEKEAADDQFAYA